MNGLGDFDNTFAGFTENGTVAAMELDSGVTYGSCLHGRELQHLGAQVLFVEACPDCETKLAAEGYEIVGPAVPFAA